MGLPWQKGKSDSSIISISSDCLSLSMCTQVIFVDVKITPLPEQGKPDYLTKVIEDALAKGAKIVNKCGGHRDRTFVAPTVLFPVNPTMKVRFPLCLALRNFRLSFQ
jgi:hypothetical protein